MPRVCRPTLPAFRTRPKWFGILDAELAQGAGILIVGNRGISSDHYTRFPLRQLRPDLAGEGNSVEKATSSDLFSKLEVCFQQVLYSYRFQIEPAAGFGADLCREAN